MQCRSIWSNHSSVHCRMQAFDRKVIAEGIMASGHVTALTGRTYGCTDQQRVVKNSPCKLGAVHTWHVSRLAYPLEERSIDADRGTI